MELVIILVCVALVVGIGAVIRNTEAPSELINLDRPSSTLADCGHVKGANVSDARKVSESSSERTDSDLAESSRSREIWFPVGMLLLIAFGFFVAAIEGDKPSGFSNDTLEAFGALGAIGAVVSGLVLLVRFERLTQRHGFSLTRFFFCLVCWLLCIFSGFYWIFVESVMSLGI